ncbi:MAG: hypothetical protein MUF14_05245 [Hyphomonadaceae bacterium]|jgi:3-deoxy-D-arabino-heptulosonate 7-phosphate (DAHP) synthase class II|nr:hypothetical protein [Hyphomonadaceae bacterium]
MASRDDLAELEAAMAEARTAYDRAVAALSWRRAISQGVKAQLAHVAKLNLDLLRAELALDRARRTGVQ